MSDMKKEDVELGKDSSNGNKKKIAIIGGIVAAVAVVILLIVSLIGGGYKKPIQNYFAGINKANAKTYLKAAPSFAKEDLEDKIDDDFLEKRKDSMEKEYGDKAKVSYKVIAKIKLSKDDLKDAKEALEKQYDDEKIKITAGYEVCVKLTMKGSDKKESTFGRYFVYKINGKWCMLPSSLD